MISFSYKLFLSLFAFIVFSWSISASSLMICMIILILSLSLSVFCFLFVFWRSLGFFCDSQNNLPVLCSFPTWPRPAFGSSPGWPVKPSSCGETGGCLAPLPTTTALPTTLSSTLDLKRQADPAPDGLVLWGPSDLLKVSSPSDCWL